MKLRVCPQCGAKEEDGIEFYAKDHYCKECSKKRRLLRYYKDRGQKPPERLLVTDFLEKLPEGFKRCARCKRALNYGMYSHSKIICEDCYYDTRNEG